MIDDVIRYAVAVTLTAVLVLMAVRWRAWVAASEMWRLLAVALGVLSMSVLLGTFAGIREDRPLGPYVGGNLTAGLIALYALALQRDTPRPDKANSTRREADTSHHTTTTED